MSGRTALAQTVTAAMIPSILPPSLLADRSTVFAVLGGSNRHEARNSHHPRE